MDRSHRSGGQPGVKGPSAEPAGAVPRPTGAAGAAYAAAKPFLDRYAALDHEADAFGIERTVQGMWP